MYIYRYIYINIFHIFRVIYMYVSMNDNDQKLVCRHRPRRLREQVTSLAPNLAQIRQSEPDSGFGFQVKGLEPSGVRLAGTIGSFVITARDAFENRLRAPNLHR